MKTDKTTPESLQEDNKLHLASRLALADPKTIAQNLVYEMEHGQKDVFSALGQLLEANHNESGKNIASYVATANIAVNCVSNYLVDECKLIEDVSSHLSKEQIQKLMDYNASHLENTPPNRDVRLIREVFGAPEIVKESEGNSYIKLFLEQGLRYAGNEALDVPAVKPEITAVRGSNTALLMLSMCLQQGFLPLRRHDGSHVNSGYNNTVIGEIYNQSHDLSQNSIAQYGVVPNLHEQILNRKIIYSFEGLPQKIKGMQRQWRGYVNDALETWRQFLMEHPEYVEKWKLNGLVDSEMRMIKPDGSPIMSTQTKQQQIPVIDYTDLAVIQYLDAKVDRLLTDEEVYSAIPYNDMYKTMLQSIDLLGMEYIMRDGKPEAMVNGMLDTSATYRDVQYGNYIGRAELSDLTDKTAHGQFEHECNATLHKREEAASKGRWAGYLIEIGQDKDKKMWVTDVPPTIAITSPDAITVERVTLPMADIEQAQSRMETRMHIMGGMAYLVDPESITVDSTLSKRDDSKVPVLAPPERTHVMRLN